MDAAKDTHYIEKCFKRKLSKITFPTRNFVDAYSYLPQEWSYGGPNICHFLNDALEWKSRSTLRLNPAKSTDCMYWKMLQKQKLYKIKFPTITLLDAYLYLLQEWS